MYGKCLSRIRSPSLGALRSRSNLASSPTPPTRGCSVCLTRFSDFVTKSGATKLTKSGHSVKALLCGKCSLSARSPGLASTGRKSSEKSTGRENGCTSPTPAQKYGQSDQKHYLFVVTSVIIEEFNNSWSLCFCLKDIYEILIQCWAKSPTDRPTFDALKARITKRSHGLKRSSLLSGYIII